MNPSSPPAPSGRDSVTRLWRYVLGFFLILSWAPAGRGANTFSPTGALAVNRTPTVVLLPNGKVLSAGGGGLDEDGYVVGHGICELFDPATGQWSDTSYLGAGRGDATATVLQNGKVLLAGGNYASSVLNYADLYNPATGTWTQTGSLTSPRWSHTATLLSNGKVLAAGGRAIGSGDGVTSSELYDPATGTWTATGNMGSRREAHTATLLPNGKVLVAGGYDLGFLNTAILYDPAAGTWTPTGSFSGPRADHTATLLPNGKVLLAGGGTAGNVTASAQLYDPATGTWSATGSMLTARKYHPATLLPNGKVLVSGGSVNPWDGSTGAELYDPATGAWSAVGSLGQARGSHGATVLLDGRVLIVAGQSGGGYLGSSEIFEPAAGSWAASGSLTGHREDHSMTPLPNGKVLIAGGFGDLDVLATTELYDPATGSSSLTGTLVNARAGHTATLLPGGKVLVAGGNGAAAELASAELYDPVTGNWAATGSMAAARLAHTATLLPDGRVLVTGGTNATGNLSSAEIYQPATGSWTTVGALTTARSNHTATLLTSGRVLVAGGFSGTALASAELFDPATGISTATGSLGAGRRFHSATLLPSGKVLVAAGQGVNYLSSAELYDPATGLWTATGALASSRRYFTATLLPNGTVLVAGGANPGIFAGAEIYSPATALWTATAPLATARNFHRATLLPGGKVLIAGGAGAAGGLASTELYDVGQGYSNAWRPQITSASYDGTGRLVLTGSGFCGVSGGSGGNSGQNASTDYPVVQVRRLDNEQIGFAMPDPGSAMSATAFTSSISSPISSVGHVLVTVFANGIPGVSSIVPYTGIAGIALEQPEGVGLANGGSRTFTASVTATANTTQSLVFTIRNSGGVGNLTGLTITKDGPDAGVFNVTANPTAPVGPGGTTTFTIQFAPTTPGTKTAALHIANNVAGSNPFNINLTGQVSAAAMVVERPGPVAVADGGSVNITTTTNTPQNLNFTIRNPGNANLTGLTITKDGATPGEFTVTANPTAPVIPAGNTTFTVQVATTTAGLKSAGLHIANNAYASNPFDISFSVRVLSYTTDGDGDGLNDAVELDMATLGFDWQVSQPALVNTFFGGANKSGLYTTAQIQTLNVGTPLIVKDPTTGKFKLTIGVQKATNLASFLDFPMSGAGKTTTVNGQGKLEFDFTVPDNAAFFRVQAK